MGFKSALNKINRASDGPRRKSFIDMESKLVKAIDTQEQEVQPTSTLLEEMNLNLPATDIPRTGIDVIDPTQVTADNQPVIPAGMAMLEDDEGNLQSLIEADVDTQQRYQGLIQNSELKPGELNPFDPESIMESVNTRAREIADTRKSTKQTMLIPEQIGQTEAASISERAIRTRQDLFGEMQEDGTYVGGKDITRLVSSEVGTVDNVISMDAMVSEAIDPNLQPELITMALNAATSAVLNDPALTMIEKQNLFDNDEDFSTLFDFDDDELPSAFGSIAEAKQELMNNQADYSMIDAAARKITSLAREAASVDRKDVDTVYDSIIGESVLDTMIANGDVQIVSTENAMNGRKYYYPLLTAQGKRAAVGDDLLIDTLIPSINQRKLSRLAPITYGQSANDSAKDVAKMLDNTADADIQAINALNRTGYTLDTQMLAVVEYLYELVTSRNGTPQEIEAAEEYFGIDSKTLSSSKSRFLEREKANQIAKGVSKDNLDLVTAERNAEKKTNKVREDKLREAARHIEMLQALKDGKVRYPDYTISPITQRFINRARDINFENKDIVRAAVTFAEKAIIPVYNENLSSKYMNMARTLKTIMYGPNMDVAKGNKALEDFVKLDDNTKNEMGLRQMYAKVYFTLFATEGDTFDNPITGRQTPMSAKRADASDLLAYYAMNHKTIMKSLGDLGDMISNAIAATAQRDPSKPSPMSALLNDPTNGPLFKQAMERGELPFIMSVLTDASTERKQKDGFFKSTAREERDANNSNVAIQSIKNGSVAGASTLGFDVATRDTFFTKEFWYKNPDSFYTLIYDDTINKSIGQTINDPDKAAAIKDFVTGMKAKEWGREVVVSGFYGLHPSVNVSAVLDILAKNPELENAAIEAYKFDRVQLIKDMLKVRGQTYRNQLADKSVSKITSALSAAIAVDGMFDLKVKSDTGATIRFPVGVLTPDYLDDTAFSVATGGKIKPAQKGYYQTRDGNVMLLSNKQDRIDYAVPRTSIIDGEVKDISKLPGKAIGDGVSAIITQSIDASLMKTALLAPIAAKSKATGKPVTIGQANAPLHDANITNASSSIEHYLAYNFTAIPSMAMQTSTFDQLADIAQEAYAGLMRKADKSNTDILIGTSFESKHTAIYGILDYYERQMNSDMFDDAGNKNSPLKNMQAKLLEKAERHGYKPPSKFDANEREFVAVSPKDFKELVKVTYQILGVLKNEGESKSYINRQLNTIRKNRAVMLEFIRKGLYQSNGQN